MSHYADIQTIREKAFTLNCLAKSGEVFASHYGIGIEGHSSVYDAKTYWFMLKKIVSNSILELAVLVRNAHETLLAHKGSDSLDKIIVCGYGDNGEIKQHDFMYLSDKIIHAKSFKLDAVGSHLYESSFEWWDGEITLSGTMYRKDWQLFFNLVEWLDNLVTYLDEVEICLKNIQTSSFDLVRCN